MLNCLQSFPLCLIQWHIALSYQSLRLHLISLTCDCAAWAHTRLHCSPCRSQPSALPCVRHPWHPLPDEGHWAGHGDTAALAPWTLHPHHLFSLVRCSAALCGGEPDHHPPVQSAFALCSSLPREETWYTPKENLSQGPPLLLNVWLHKSRLRGRSWSQTGEKRALWVM